MLFILLFVMSFCAHHLREEDSKGTKDCTWLLQRYRYCLSLLLSILADTKEREKLSFVWMHGCQWTECYLHLGHLQDVQTTLSLSRASQNSVGGRWPQSLWVVRQSQMSHSFPSHPGVIAMAWMMYMRACQMRRQLADRRKGYLSRYYTRLKSLGDQWKQPCTQQKRVEIHLPSLGLW